MTISSWVVAGCPGLQTLNLDYTKITDAGLVHLAGLTNLKLIGVLMSQLV